MASNLAYRYKKMIAAVGFGVRTSATEVDSTVPTITAGAGAPSASAPNGSVYLRTNGGTADLAIYVRQGGAWIPMLGAS